MVKVINGKRYNTDTATEIGSRWNGLSDNDFHHVSEKLFITKKGNYFLHGVGGAATKYSESNGNTSWSSSDIISLSKQDAFDWCEEHNLIETIEKYFADMIEDA